MATQNINYKKFNKRQDDTEDDIELQDMPSNREDDI